MIGYVLVYDTRLLVDLLKAELSPEWYLGSNGRLKSQEVAGVRVR